MKHNAYIAARSALAFYIDHGVDAGVAESQNLRISESQNLDLSKPDVQLKNSEVPRFGHSEMPLGKADAHAEAVKLAQAAQSLDALKQTITDFNGIGLKKTATNLVFADGNPKAKIMLIGEAPGADEDRKGKPFVGASGQLMDKILACIDLDRHSDDLKNAVYISNIINWRPPGNRTPNPAEIEVSLPFIERHIQLIAPKLIILCGGVAAKSLLGSSASISKLRKTWHDYTPQTQMLAGDAKPIPAIATYHPAYLLRTPIQKKAVWADMLMLQKAMLAMQ